MSALFDVVVAAEVLPGGRFADLTGQSIESGAWI
jgi:hypothetical protein